MVCVQKQDGTFKVEETLIQMLFTNREVSLKQPREGSSPECGENYEERSCAVSGRLPRRVGTGEISILTSCSFYPQIFCWCSHWLSRIHRVRESIDVVYIGQTSRHRTGQKRMKGSFEKNYCLPKSLQQLKGMWTTVFPLHMGKLEPREIGSQHVMEMGFWVQTVPVLSHVESALE